MFFLFFLFLLDVVADDGAPFPGRRCLRISCRANRYCSRFSFLLLILVIVLICGISIDDRGVVVGRTFNVVGIARTVFGIVNVGVSEYLVSLAALSR